MLAPFDLDKAIQASAILLSTETDRRMSRLRLLKLLYIADREMLAMRGRPIIGDAVVAMDNGPVLSRVYNLIKRTREASERERWDTFIQQSGPRDLVLVADPGNGAMTPKEEELLRGVAERFKDSDDWAVADYTHDFEEWKKNKPPKGSRLPISDDDLLGATNLLEHKDAIVSEAKAEASLKRMR